MKYITNTQHQRLKADCLGMSLVGETAHASSDNETSSFLCEMDGLKDTSGIDGEVGRRSVTDHPRDVRNRSR